MRDKKDGGPAFACAASNGHQPGMTIRDYFAAKVMHAIIAGNDADVAVTDKYGVAGMSKDAYIVADAMLVERSK